MARRAAVLCSLLRSCFALGIDPRRYRLDALDALAHTPVSKLSTLTPNAYAARMQGALAAALSRRQLPGVVDDHGVAGVVAHGGADHALGDLVEVLSPRAVMRS